MQPLEPYHRKRCRRRNTPGQSHFLTFSCFHRRRFLTRERSRQWLWEAIRAAQQKHDFSIWAWVFMPEHVHLVLWPRRADYEISRILQSMKQPVSLRAITFVREQSATAARAMEDRQPNGQTALRFWQRGGGYDRNLRSGADIWEKIDYTHRNPVERGLCARAEDWEWSSARDYAKLRETPLLPLDFATIPWRR